MHLICTSYAHHYVSNTSFRRVSSDLRGFASFAEVFWQRFSIDSAAFGRTGHLQGRFCFHRAVSDSFSASYPEDWSYWYPWKIRSRSHEWNFPTIWFRQESFFFTNPSDRLPGRHAKRKQIVLSVKMETRQDRMRYRLQELSCKHGAVWPNTLARMWSTQFNHIQPKSQINVVLA